MAQYPETAIISITSHGTVIMRKGDTFPVENIEIVKYADVPPGTCNVMPERTAIDANRFISENRKRLEDSTIDEAYTLVKEEMVPFFKELKKPIVRGNMGEEDPTVATYVHTHDHGYLTEVYREGDRMLNKTYTTEVERRHGFDWQISWLNAPGQPDIFQSIMGRRHHGNSGELDMKTIVAYLQELGVRKIIFFDFSCSNCVRGSDDVTVGRRVRDAFVQRGLIGGSKRRLRSVRKNIGKCRARVRGGNLWKGPPTRARR